MASINYQKKLNIGFFKKGIDFGNNINLTRLVIENMNKKVEKICSN